MNLLCRRNAQILGCTVQRVHRHRASGADRLPASTKPPFLLRAVRRGRPAARGGAEPPPLAEAFRSCSSSVSPLILRARTGTSRASPAGFVFPRRTVTSTPSPAAASATSPQRKALTSLRRIPAMKSRPAITASSRPRFRATSSDSTPRPRDVGKKLDRLAARQGWYTFMAGQAYAVAAGKHPRSGTPRFMAVEQVLRWRAEVSRFAPDRLAEFDKLVADALNNPVPVQHSDR